MDERPLYRRGLAVAVNGTPGFVVVAEAGCRSEALRKVRTLHPDLALVDGGLAQDRAIAIAAALRLVRPVIRVLICRTFLTEAELNEAGECGTHGYVLKTADLAAIRGALIELMPGGSGWSAERTGQPRRGSPLPSLSPREREVVVQAASGASDKEIAQALRISRYTVVEYLSKARLKLGARNRAELSAVAQRQGLLPP